MTGEEGNVVADEVVAALLEAHRAFSRERQQTPMESIQAFVAAYNAGQISIEVKDQIVPLTVAALRIWRNRAARVQPLDFAAETRSPPPSALVDVAQASTREDDTPTVRKAKARLYILEAHREWQFKTRRLGWGTIGAFAEAYASCEIIVPSWVREEYPGIGRAALGRWWRTYEKTGPGGLKPSYGNRKGSGLFDNDPDLKQAVVALRQEHPRMTAAEMLDRLQRDMPGRALPSRRSLQRFLKAFT